MTLKIQILLIILLVAVLIAILHMVKKRVLELKYVLAWILCDIALMFFVLFPDSMNTLSAFLGIYSPVNMIFFLGFLFAMAIIFSMTVALSRVTSRVRKLAQRMALDGYSPDSEIIRQDSQKTDVSSESEEKA